jgi:dTDP-glucose pyrophosphorylase
MKQWKKAVIPPTASVRDTIRTIDEGAIQIAFVVDGDNRLLGTVTDGDIRRAILRSVSLDGEARLVMNPHPVTAPSDMSRQAILEIMRHKLIHQIPILDRAGRIVDVELLDNLLMRKEPQNWVVLMAGGLGTRLRPLTDELPKPMLKIANKPLLEIILENFIEQGFRKFYFSVNYKADMVQSHFADGSHWDAEIRYLRETERMGTAGPLSLLPERLTHPVIVMNADLLTKLNFHQLLDFHHEHRAKATMCVREYDFQVPYGVVSIENTRIVAIDEKPVQRFFVNAGVYVLEPEALDLIPASQFYDMPELFSAMIERKWESAVFPIREYWLDVGRLEDFQRANGEYAGEFE